VGFPELADSTLVLMEIDSARLRTSEVVAVRLSARNVEATLDRARRSQAPTTS
jgi:hypothetical protein